MVTGDEPTTAYAIGAMIGIPKSHILASAMPQDKESFIESLQSNHSKHVAFIGDGTNDANALARADVGLALGGGTDVAIDTGDMVLVNNDLSSILIALDVSKICFRRIKLNYFWALIYNVVLLPIAAGVFYPSYQFALEPMYAGAAMALSSVSIVLSSLSLMMYKVPSAYTYARSLYVTSKVLVSVDDVKIHTDGEEEGVAMLTTTNTKASANTTTYASTKAVGPKVSEVMKGAINASTKSVYIE